MTDQAGVDEPHDLELLRMLAAEHKASPEQLAALAAWEPVSDPDAPDWEPHISEEKKEGLFLTQQEWDDLAAMVVYYRKMTNDYLPEVRRRRALAERIIEANK